MHALVHLNGVRGCMTQHNLPGRFFGYIISTGMVFFGCQTIQASLVQDNMSLSYVPHLLFASSTLAGAAIVKRAQFAQGQPIDDKGKGAPLLGSYISFHLEVIKLIERIGGTNKPLDLQNPDNLGQQSTDAGLVPNLKWSFSDSKTKLFPGGWVREQVVTDLPASHDISAAQQHLKKGALRELHWHRVVRCSRC